MMSIRRAEAQSLCILRVSREILNISNVVVTDQNAASDYVRFLAPVQMNSQSAALLHQVGCHLPAEINSDLFFG